MSEQCDTRHIQCVHSPVQQENGSVPPQDVCVASYSVSWLLLIGVPYQLFLAKSPVPEQRKSDAVATHRTDRRIFVREHFQKLRNPILSNVREDRDN
jgi:hypothetical protein